jgi:transcriptional regulator with AAA-type ATPase domain
MKIAIECQKFRWSGNIRQLRNNREQISVLKRIEHTTNYTTILHRARQQPSVIKDKRKVKMISQQKEKFYTKYF